MNLSRRKFIGTAAAGMGAVLLNQHFVDAVPFADEHHDPYEIVELGKTGIKTTRLCMGTGIRGGNRQSNYVMNNRYLWAHFSVNFYSL